ncbi:type II CAAX endopeptidase family protein [uncultured Methanoregula sp.]|uniref:CPBP family intramembrane glutamic endopeptidase n=1 Tax=uncultured Methanoregula sp. TaxID=1005933 RepID=UPI002AABDB82|nr:type II CAAX endopeptidase family protein [uncultured Methanoregula sp.]
MTISRRFIAMIATFTILAFAISLLLYALAPVFLVLYHAGIPIGILNAIVVWGSGYSPAIAAVITAILFRRDLRSFGWGPGKIRYYACALAIAAALVILGKGLLLLVPGLVSPVSGPAHLDLFALGGTFLFLLALNLGEEIGWRGFLVPELMEGTGSFILAGLVSAILWAAWHFPKLLWSNPPGVPVWAAFIDMTIGFIGISFVYCWLRLASGSIWPCLLLHTVSDWIGSCWEPLYVTGQAVHGTAGMVPQFGFDIGSSLLLAAIVIWYVKRHPVGVGSAG